MFYERPNTIDIAKFQDEQVWTLKTHPQPAAIAPNVVISNPFNELHVPKDATVQPSHIRNSARAAQQLDIVSHIVQSYHPHSCEYLPLQNSCI